MRTTGKQPIKPTPSVGVPIMVIDADPPEGDQERDEEDVSDTRNYQLGTNAFRQAAAGESDERHAASEEAPEARDTQEDEISEHEQDHNVSPKPKARAQVPRPSKTQRPSKDK